MKYVYPAVFTPEDSGRFSVNFPDLESCYTCGDDLGDALYMAEDVLAMTLVSYEDKGLAFRHRLRHFHWKQENFKTLSPVIQKDIESRI